MYYGFESSDDTVQITVLQPNIDPYDEKYERSNTDIAKLLVTLSNQHSTAKTDFILAPETVFAKNVRLQNFENEPFLHELKRGLSGKPRASWLTGISFIDFFNDPNSAIIFGCGVIVSAIFIIGVTKSLYGPKK